VLGEKAGTLVLRSIKTNLSDAAKKEARKARFAYTSVGDSAGSQPQQGPSKGMPPSRSIQTQIPQEPGTSGIQTKGRKNYCSAGLVRLGLKFPKVRSPPGKWQRRSGALLRAGRRTVQLNYARAASAGLWMSIVCCGYAEAQVSQENFFTIQRVINEIVDKPPERGFTHRLIDTYWAKGTAIVVCQGEETRDLLGSKVPTMSAWEGCRLKM